MGASKIIQPFGQAAVAINLHFIFDTQLQDLHFRVKDVDKLEAMALSSEGHKNGKKFNDQKNTNGIGSSSSFLRGCRGTQAGRLHDQKKYQR